MAQDSVFDLVNKLCSKVYEKKVTSDLRWQPRSPKKRQEVIRKLRKKCFEILLNKTSLEDHLEEEEPMFLLLGCVLELQWDGREEDATRIKACGGYLLTHGLHRDEHMMRVLALLLRLRGSVQPHIDLRPKLFRYARPEVRSPAEGAAPFDVLPLSAFAPPAWMQQLAPVGGVDTMLPPAGAFPFAREPGHGLPMLGRFITPVRWDGKRRETAPFEFPVFPELKEPRRLNIPKISLLHPEQVDEGYGTPSREGSPNGAPGGCRGMREEDLERDAVWVQALTFDLPRYRTWEALGQRLPPKELPFLSDAGPDAVEKVVDILIAHLVLPTPRVVNREDFVKDVGHLLRGFPSHTFPYDEETRLFRLAEGTCLKGLTNEALQGYCQPFLEAGSCCRRLQDFSSGSLLAQGDRRQTGLVMQVLQGHVRRFLQFHWGVLLLLPLDDAGLMGLARWADGVVRRVVAMAQLCCLAPSRPPAPHAPLGPPHGMALVAHLYEALGRETTPDLACLIYSTLKACTHIYFRFLQRWIFEGVLQDACDEFFVRPAGPAGVPWGQGCGRKDWAGRFRLEQDAVPGFLRGLEQEILLCGKTMLLLKLCCPKAPLCVAVEGGYPSMPCCLQGREVRHLAGECSRFEARVRRLAGAPTLASAADLWPRHATSAEQLALQEAVAQAQHQHLLKAKLEREAGRQAHVMRQTQLREELQQQAADAQAHREAKRSRELSEERALHQQWEQRQRQDELRLQQEKQRLVEYYEELSDVADRRRQRAEWRAQRLKLSEQREQFLLNERKEWRALTAELNARNTLGAIAEDVRPPLTLEQPVPTDTAGGTAETDNLVNIQVTPNNNETCDLNENTNNNNNNNNNNNVNVVPNLLDTSNEDAALGNVITLQPVPLAAAGDAAAVSSVATTTAEVGAEGDTVQSARQEVLSAAARNRRRVMEQEFDIVLKSSEEVQQNEPAESSEAQQAMRREQWNDTENQRNRNRWNMLHGDVNIVTGSTRAEAAAEQEARGDAAASQNSTEEAEAAVQEPDNRGGRAAPPRSLPQLEIAKPCRMGAQSVVSPDEEHMSVTKSESNSSMNVYKCASALSSKTSSSYNIASITSSSSFDLGSGKLALGTPTSTDGSVDTFKSCGSGGNNGPDVDGVCDNTVRSNVHVQPAAFWNSSFFTHGAEDKSEGHDTAGEEDEDDQVRTVKAI